MIDGNGICLGEEIGSNERSLNLNVLGRYS